LIDAEVWLRAEEDTERHRGQIQGFCYKGRSGEGKPARHVIRDCWKKSGDQVLWSREGTDEEYEAINEEMNRMIRFFEIELISDRYEELMG